MKSRVGQRRIDPQSMIRGTEGIEEHASVVCASAVLQMLSSELAPFECLR